MADTAKLIAAFLIFIAGMIVSVTEAVSIIAPAIDLSKLENGSGAMLALIGIMFFVSTVSALFTFDILRNHDV